MDRARVGGGLVALRQSVITHHRADTQPVTGKNSCPASGLTLAVAHIVAPDLYRLLVAPER